MEKKCTARYHWQDRFKGSQSLEILENRYLKVREAFPRRRREFGIDVACLSPDFRQTNSVPTKWLGAAGGTALLALGSGWYGATMPDDTAVLYGLSGAVVLLLVAAIFVVVAWRARLRGYTLQTRLAGVPLVLVESPRASDARALAAFLEKLRPCIEHVEQGRGLSADELRSGEVRTLRRLASESAIASTDYEQAKRQILSSA